MLQCPHCCSPLADPPSCPSCGKTFDAPFGVPVLVAGAVVERASPPSDQFVADISAALGGAPADQVRECFSLRVKMPNPGMQVEADQFANRMRSTGHAIDGGQERAPRAHVSVNVLGEIALRLDPLIWPQAIAAGSPHGVSMRVSNVGACALSSDADPPLRIAYHWHSATGEVIEGGRTPLLIDLPPGRTITLPVGVLSPNHPGTYRLVISPVLEGVTWFPQHGVGAAVQVESTIPALPWVHEIDGPQRSYAEDHERGVAILAAWIDQHIPAQEPEILEIGGNFYPTTAQLPKGRRWNLDVDAHALMARNIVGDGGIRSIVADGSDLPFADRSLDVITMFAAFHHFPDPIGLLQHLAQKVKHEGLVCLMCEPVGHAHRGHVDFIRELESGVNEQSFEVWEYAAMMEAAGLEIIEAKFDRGSAKIAARPATRLP